MRFSDYSHLAGQALAKNTKGVVNAINAVIANEEGKNSANARALKDLLYQHGRRHEAGIMVDMRLPMIRRIEPKYTFSELVFPSIITDTAEIIKQERANIDLLAKYSLEPRNRILCAGEPGTGKTAFAHALAASLDLPFYTANWPKAVGQFLGETSKLIDSMFEWMNDHEGVFLFDEVDTILRERDDKNEVGEIKRVVCNILPLLENLNPRMILVATTNHPQILDTAVWRRFQSILNFPDANVEGFKSLLDIFLEKHHLEVGNIYFDIRNTQDLALKKLNYGSFTNLMENALRQELVEKECDVEIPSELFSTVRDTSGEKVSPEISTDDITICDRFMCRLSLAVRLL